MIVLVDEVDGHPVGTTGAVVMESADGETWAIELSAPADEIIYVPRSSCRVTWPINYYYQYSARSTRITSDDDLAYAKMRWEKIEADPSVRLVQLRSSMVWWSAAVRDALELWPLDWRYNITSGENIEALIDEDDAQALVRFLARIAPDDPDALTNPDDLKAGLAIVAAAPEINRDWMADPLTGDEAAAYFANQPSMDELRALAGLPPTPQDPFWSKLMDKRDD
ncbi:MAG: hypothetical protein DI554_00385 [Sphingobium sp.]|nr:MAG: hypothetical protein DI554_00385 [Sphingobium sp.]